MERLKIFVKLSDSAELRTIIDDQGGGMSYCSACDTEIKLSELKGMICPNPKCGKLLIWTDPYINRGGSDF
jgi:predicted RNA-binding Zn-ribbon protein involved in translation (DUF1610 family)